jgi:hypothetical protein
MDGVLRRWSRVFVVGLPVAAAVGAFCPCDAHGANPTGDAAAANQAQFNATYAQLAAKYGTERDVSPTKGVFPAGNPNNGVHVPNYGLRADYLTGSPPSAGGGRVSTNIGGLTATNVGNPPDVSGMHQRDIRGKSRHFHPSKAIGRARLEKSAQNIWAAEETLAHVQSLGACSGKAGNDLVNCAKGHQRPLPASPPAVGGGSTQCVGFVYNRYYDIERWTDRVNACGEDVQCKATITLDASDGIAGKLLSGSDGAPGNRQFLQNLMDLNAGSRHGLPDCTRKDLKGQDLQACEYANSLPPIAHIEPTYFWPLAGGGAPVGWNCNGTLSSSTFCLRGSSSDPSASPVRGYLTAKNDFYAAAGNLPSAQIVTPTVANAFASDPAKLQSVQRLIAELNRGQGYYYVGQSPAQPAGVARYADEWAFQRHMSDATRGTSLAAFHDYAKRRAFVRQRGQTFSALYNAATNPAPSFAIPAGAVDQIRAGMPGGVLGMTPSGHDAFPSPVDYTPSLTGAVPNARDSVAHLWRADLPVPPTPTAIDRFAWGSSGPQMDPAYKYPRLLCPVPDKLEAGFPSKFQVLATGPGALPNPLPVTPIAGPARDGSMPTPSPGNASDVATAACNFINAILDEWARKDQPQVLAPNDKTPPPAASGCFANDPACDWDPGEFMSGMNDLVHAQIKNVEYPREEADYKFCREWADASGVRPADNEFVALGKMKAKLQGAYNQISNVPVRNRGPHKGDVPWATNAHRSDNDRFATFGEDRTNAETWGNDLFGVGYSFETGWEIPIEWERVDTKENYDVCNVGAGAHGGFEAYAYAFGSDKFDVLDADLASGMNDYEDLAVPGTPNQTQLNDNMNHAAFDLDFAVAGDSLFDQDQRLAPSGYSAQPAQGANSWTLFNIPFQITFITVDISVGIGYSYEIDAKVTPSNQPDVCHDGNEKPPAKGWPAPKSRPQLQLSANLDAQGELDGIIDASASLAGLAGIGVECDITLLGIGLPANATASITPNGLSLDTSLNMELSTLNGSLSVYAEALFFKLFDITIISWDGIDSRVPLFNTSTSAAFPNLDPLGATGLQNPARTLVGL